LDLLIDTHTILWVALDSIRLSPTARSLVGAAETRLFVSAVTAWEYCDLNQRGRFGSDLPLGPLLDGLQATILDFPAGAWLLAESLPDLHRDPVDRMLIAHAILSHMTLVTADRTIRAYPVPTLW
jgi:PIN domain nuclease of toxin-antitoxin system